MATAQGTNSLTSLSQRFLLPKANDLAYGSNPIFFRLNQGRRMEIPGGYQIEVPLLHRKATTGGPFQGWDVVDVSPQDNFITAAWDWSQQYEAVSIDKGTLIKSQSPEAKFNLLRSNFNVALMNLADKMGTGLQSDGTDTKQIVGFKLAVDDAGVATTYAGVSRSTYTNWRSTDDSSTATLTIAALRTNFLAAKSGGHAPTLLYSDINQYSRYLALGEAAQQYPVGASGHDEQMFSAGFTNILFMNVPWVEESHTFAGPDANNSALVGLNEQFIHLGVNPGADFTMSDFSDNRAGGQIGWVSTIDWMGQLIVENPARQFKMTNLSA